MTGLKIRNNYLPFGVEQPANNLDVIDLFFFLLKQVATSFSMTG